VSKPSVQIDTRNFSRAMQGLSRLTGVSFKNVIVAEAGAILRKTISNQMAADAGKIKARKRRGKNPEAEIRELLARRGLAKQSWLAIGKKLGMDLTAPAYVRRAAVKGVAYDQKVSVSERKVGGLFTIIVENDMQTTVASRGRIAILRAMNGRVGYFKRNLRAGVFEKVATMAKKYPGLSVKGF
jgi:hypothetical protein